MLSRSVKFAHVVLLVFAALVSFLFLREMEQQMPLEASEHVMVQDDPTRQQASSAQVTAAVEAVARDQRATLARQTPDLQHPESTRHLYLAVGDPQAASAEWLHSGYPVFGRDVRTVAHPIDESRDLEPRGEYYVFGSRHAGRELAAALEPLGFQAQVQPLSLSTWIGESADGPHTEVLAWCALAVLLAAVIAVGAGVVLNGRSYGVLRLHGYGFGRVLWRDAVQLVRFWVPAAAVVTACAVGGLALYNGLAGWSLFVVLAGLLLAGLTVAAVAAHLVALALTQRIPMLRALKGDISAPWTLVSVYGVRVAAALLALTVVGSAVEAGQRMGEYQATRAAYADIGPATHIALKGRVSPRERERMQSTIGPWLRERDRAGELVLTVNQDRLGDYSTLQTADPHRNVLVVNNVFLRQQDLRDAEGSPIRGVEPGERNAQVLLPHAPPGDPAAIVDAVTQQFSMGHTPDGFSRHARPLHVDTARMQADQSVFTYGAGVGNKAEYRSFVRDPVIVVLGDSAGILDGDLGNSSYTAFASQGYAALTRPELAQQALREPQLRKYVYGMSPVAEQAAIEYRDMARELRLAVLDAVTALGVLALTGIAVAVVYTRKGAQRVVVRHINGWAFTKAHRLLIVAESTLAAVLVGATAWETWSVLRAEQSSPSTMDPLPLGGWEPVVMLGVTGTGVGITLAGVAVLQRRLVRNRSAET